MEMITHHKYMSLALGLLSLMVLLIRPISNHLEIMWPSRAPEAPVRRLPVIRYKARKIPPPHAKAADVSLKKQSIIPEEAAPSQDELSLRTFLKDYLYTFKGQILCGDTPCAKDIELVLNTDKNVNIRLSRRTAEDGSFEVVVPFREHARVPLEWTLMAKGSDGVLVHSSGRRILLDDSTDTVDASLTLQ